MDKKIIKQADGDAGARFASAIIGIAACAQVSNATLNQESNKVDISLTFPSTFQEKKLLSIQAQIKTGQSYQTINHDKDTFTLKVDRETKNTFAAPGSPGIIVYVSSRPVEKIFWHSVDPRRPFKGKIKINRMQFVRPSIRYDLTRLCLYSAFNNRLPRQTVSIIDDDKILYNAKKSYNQLKTESFFNPLLGNVAVTRFAWRHVTRRSKTLKRVISTIKVTPYLKAFIDKHPTRYVCDKITIKKRRRITYETRYLLFWYADALMIAGRSNSLLLRMKEDISYPSDWAKYGVSERDIKQKVTLASWWHKENK
ncbi:MAG: hypothetical protein WCV72_03765 [Patescibacteria group bacterium]|jgi:hypothetical protein